MNSIVSFIILLVSLDMQKKFLKFSYESLHFQDLKLVLVSEFDAFQDTVLL